jgi:hypothetical protein
VPRARPTAVLGRSREKEKGSGPAQLGWAGRMRGGPGERGREGRTSVQSRTGLVRVVKRKTIFFFSKIPNSTKFCLFLCELFRAPKMIKNFCSLFVLCNI